ncbi:MAG: enoyl-CoA hydratase/isomerase family protein [Candidatus Rokubacteria bacterium]|nr:enoyl-CoA hydratase/isomerase family protein [Candidatus Rokubacteria bacterium]
MGTNFVGVKLDGPVAFLELNRPPANAYNLDFLKDLDAAIEEVRYLDAAKVVIVKGTPKFFSAGADINSFLGAPLEALTTFALVGHQALDKLERLPKVVIAAIEGHALGGGLEIAMACDLRFMARGSGRLGLVEAKIGAVPNMGGTQRLPRLVGKGRALHMMITGETVTADEALAIGLVDRVFEPNELLPKIAEYAKTLAQGPTLTIGLIKRCVTEGLEMPLAGGLSLERTCGGIAFASEDFQEGSRAFVEKRAPSFRGR